jgi:hypothetical protein
MKIIYSTDLTAWADTKDSQQFFPHLIRRLIYSLSSSIKYLDIPIGDSTYKPGLDGIVEQYDIIANIPIGTSAWECGVGKDVQSKANEDYAKRLKQNDLPVEKKETTFVFVTPRYFKDKDKWINAKKQDSVWKDIHVIDVDMLEALLENTRSVAIWFAKYKLGKTLSNDLCDLSSYWRDIAYSTTIKKVLLPDIFLAGRDKEVKEINSCLSASSTPVFIASNSVDESIAFIYGALDSKLYENSEQNIAKSILVKSEEEFREIINISSPQIIITKFAVEDIGLLHIQSSIKHIILVPIDKAMGRNLQNEQVIVLSQLDSYKFTEKLIESGFTANQALFLTNKSGLQFSPFRRHAGMSIKLPQWSTDKELYKLLFPFMFLNSWNEHSVGDKEVIAKISKLNYVDYIKLLLSIKSISDSPIINIGDYFRASSIYDLWINLAQYLTADDITLFRKCVLDIFKETDPALELDLNQRHLADLFNKKRNYSDSIIKGILESLAIISRFGDDFGESLFNFNSQAWCDHLIKEVLKDATSEFWITYHHVLPLIAEASPSQFLDAIKWSLKQTSMPIMALFNETEAGYFSPNYHCGLLWALEKLALLPDYLTVSCISLTKLAQLDPGGKLVNRPINSLKNILNPLAPQNSSSLNDMYEVICCIVQHNEKIACDICLSSLNTLVHGCSVSRSPRPAWSEIIAPQDRVTTNNELAEYIDNLFGFLLEHSSLLEKNLADLISLSIKFDLQRFNKVLAFIKLNNENIKNSNHLIYKEIKKIINLKEQYPDADWATPSKYIDELKLLQVLFYPSNMLERAILHFDSRGFYGFMDEDAIREDTAIIKPIFDEFGTTGIINLANRVTRKHDLALACNSLIFTNEEISVLYGLLETTDDIEFIRVLIFMKSRNQSVAWFNAELRFLQINGITVEGQVKFLTSLEPSDLFYEFIDSLDDQLRLSFWRKANLYIHTDTVRRIYIIDNFIIAGRYFDILQSFYHTINNIPSHLLLKVLYLAGTTPAIDSELLNPNTIQMVFNELDNRLDVDNQQLIQLELIYLNILNRVGSTRHPVKLHNEMATNPNFFMEVICAMYRPEDNQIIDYSSPAFYLLENWQIIPGICTNKADGDAVNSSKSELGVDSVDYKTLSEWTTIVREQGQIKEQVAIIDEAIGKVFSYSPKENDMWPHSSICNIIEEVDSHNLSNAFVLGTLNKRGLHAVDGGKSEHTLKEQYLAYANLVKNKYPTVAGLLRTIADHYSYDSHNYKQQAELQKLIW